MNPKPSMGYHPNSQVQKANKSFIQLLFKYENLLLCVCVGVCGCVCVCVYVWNISLAQNSQELYSFNITLGSILQHFITMYKIVNMIIIIIATIHACNCCKHAHTDTWVCFQFDHIVYVLYTAHEWS